MTELDELISSRSSCRKFLDTPVPRDLLEKLISAAQRAPSARNQQPWHFYVVNNKELTTKIGKQAQVRLLEHEPKMAERAETFKVSNILFYDAPTVIFCTCNKKAISTRYLDMGLAIENILLMAERLGLGCVPVGWIVGHGKDIVDAELKIPEDEELVLAIPVGYKDTSVDGGRRDRKENIVTWID
ncbi:putative nitroreductase family protein [Blattamonas nauphoetae]|uniref:Nitroreductase family protein n=1 Tax=Blattamonas nauphoetae TaxID=2049346 RepID=A0ABQ9XX12_9EUKA|nr:putative nitroreductase family protein [Blattamonas nauphoetae]